MILPGHSFDIASQRTIWAHDSGTPTDAPIPHKNTPFHAVLLFDYHPSL